MSDGGRLPDEVARVLIVGQGGPVDAVVDERIRSLHDCEFVETATGARARAAREQFGAVVLFGLAGGEGPDFSLLRALVAAQRDAAVVVVSALADPSVAERAFAAGAHSYLLLPLSSRQLEISIAGRMRQCQAERSQSRKRHGFLAQVEEVMHQAAMPIFIKDTDGRYTFANAEAHRFVGLGPGRLIGLRDADLLPADEVGAVHDEDRRILSEGATFERERSFNLNGRPRTYLVNKFPYRDFDGAITGVFGMSVDITDRKVSEALRAAFAAEQRNLIYELQLSREETADRLSRALQYRDHVSGEHVSRMAMIAAYLGELLGMSPEDVILLRAAAPMHDVGKIAIPDEVLQKPGRLNEAEQRLMQRHARIGFEILDGSTSEVLRLGATIALTHHERWDGKGYPRRLRGEQIPFEGRIAAVADVFDALFSDRPYRPALTKAEVRSVIADGRGTLFDPAVANALLENFETALLLRNAEGRVSDSSLARLVESSLDRRAA